MAVNESRSLNLDLIEGLTDGMVIKSTPNRGGSTEYPDNGWNNEQYGNSKGDSMAQHVANRVYGVKRSGQRTH